MSYETTRRQFGAAAGAYSYSAVHRDGPDLVWMVEAAAPEPHHTVLDVGVGAGFAAFALAPRVAQVIGIDITPEMLAEARANAAARGISNFEALLADAEAMPFPDESFDVVVCRYVAHHFHNPARAVGEAARVLRPGGRFVVVDNTAPDDPRLDQWINTVEKLRDPSHVREWTEAEWHRFFRDAGLTFTVVRTWLLPLRFDDWVKRQRTPPEKVAQLKALFRDASPLHRETFAIGDGQFSLLTRLMLGVKPGGAENAPSAET